MSNETDPLHSELSSIRAEAWDVFPLWRQMAVRFVWRRLGYTPMWNLKPTDPASEAKPPFDIIGGMFIYSLSRDMVETAPGNVLLAVYGCLLAHTSRFWYRSADAIHTNGNGDIQLLPTWAKSLRIAESYGFAVDQMRQWLTSNDTSRNT